MGGEPPLRATRARLLAAALLALAGASDASAQGSRSIYAIPTQVSLPTPGTADFDFGYVQHQGTVQLSVDVPGNGTWTVLVRCDDPHLGGYGKPVADLFYRPAGDSVWRSASAGEQTLQTGSGDATLQVEVAMRLAWEADLPDDYAGALQFRVTN